VTQLPGAAVTSVYVSDLDGTLLRDDVTLSAFSRHVLAELLSEHLPFTVASARSVVSIRDILAGLELALPIVEFNGAFISDLGSGQHQLVNSIEPAIVADVYQLVGTAGCTPFVSTFDGVEDCLYYSTIANEGMQWYLEDRQQQRDGRLRFIDDLTLSFRDQVVCLTVIGTSDALFELATAIKDRYPEPLEVHCIENRYSPGWYWLTVYDHRATKDQAIRILLEESGLDGSEIVVFGDSSNDVRMFQWADRAIAVANATDELKRYATQIIGSNNEDSVVRFIRSDWGRQRAV
jgi:Cof subfamily protein (haloacid dehalogenase superfamily)